MALAIKNFEVERSAQELSKVTGKSLTEAVSKALVERLEREKSRLSKDRFKEEIQRIQKRVTRLQCLDDRNADEIVGYDNRGISV